MPRRCLRLQREIDREAAGQAAGTTAQWQAALREVLWVARSHLGEGWQPFAADVRAKRRARGYVGALSAQASWGWSESVTQMPWRVQTFWLADRRTGRWLLAISAVSGSRVRSRLDGGDVGLGS